MPTERSGATGGRERVRVAVVGLGIGQSHLAAYKALSDRFEVVAVCDPDGDRAASATARLRNVGTMTFDEVCASDDVDVVDVCTPPFLHLSQVTAALDAGKHVVCEKPVVGSLADLDAIAAHAAAVDRVVMPVFQYRFAAGFERLVRLVRAGVAGRAYTASIEVSWRRGGWYYAADWRGRWGGDLGGVLMTHAVHHLDMATQVLGPIRCVSAAVATRVNEIENEDCAAAILTTADGALVSLSATLGSVDEISRNRFCFEHLSAESNTEAYAHGCEPWQITPADDQVAERMAAVPAPDEPAPEGYVAQFAALADALAGSAPLPVTLADARAALEVVTACYVSSVRRAEVVLPITADDPAHGGFHP